MIPQEASYQGLWTAIATPFHDDGRIDWESWEKMLQLQADAGVTGLVVCGTTGESPTLTVQEKLSLVRKAKVLVGEQLLIMAGTGGQSTDQSVELSRLAADAGADCLLIVTPPYNKPNLQGLKEHFRLIGQQARVPLCLYHVPSRTGQRLTPEMIAELCQDPAVVLVKEASGDLALFTESQLLADAQFLSGDDFTFLASLAVGGRGCISVASNLFPHAMVRMQQLFEAGKAAQALEIHEVLYPLFKALFCESNPCPLKAALAHLGLCRNSLRLPLAAVSTAHGDYIVRTLEETRQRLTEIAYEA